MKQFSMFPMLALASGGSAPSRQMQFTAVPIATKIVGLVLAVYLIAFVWCFDVFSSPVRNNKQRWLGPLIRGDTHSVDIGKTYDYTSKDLFYYCLFWPLCKVWLTANGL